MSTLGFPAVDELLTEHRLPLSKQAESLCIQRLNADKNPTLTIMALTWRASDYLLDQAKKGNL